MKTRLYHHLLKGNLRLGTKADIFRCIVSEERQSNAPAVGSNVVDSVTMVQMFNPGTAMIFHDLFRHRCVYHIFDLNSNSGSST